jgi:hypothetical protein
MVVSNSGSVGRGKPFFLEAAGSREQKARPATPMPPRPLNSDSTNQRRDR